MKNYLRFGALIALIGAPALAVALPVQSQAQTEQADTASAADAAQQAGQDNAPDTRSLQRNMPMMTMPEMDKDHISEDEIRFYISKLASDEFGGRRPGTEGEGMTIRFISGSWAAYGLVSGTNDPQNEWYQPVDLIERKTTDSVGWFTDAKGKPMEFDANDLVLTGSKTDNEAEGPMAFVGYGVDANGKVTADVQGKVVLTYFGNPDFAKGNDDFPNPRERRRALMQAGALGVIMKAPEGLPFSQLRKLLSAGNMELAERDDPLPAVSGYASDSLWQQLLSEGGIKSSEQKKSRKAGYAGKAMKLNAKLDSAAIVFPFTSHNVIGKLPGKHPEKGAVVLLGHWDHFGTCRDEGEKDRICNGAVDNASGIAALLAAARVLAAGEQLDRDVYFLATTAEEQGLLGAHYFADHPPIALKDIEIALNLDTIAIAGADAPVAIIGRGNPLLEDKIGAIETVIRSVGRTVDEDDEANAFVARQDGWALFDKQVPATMVGGSFSDMNLLQKYLGGPYHGPSDELTEDTPLAGATQDAELHVALARYFANLDTWPGDSAAAQADEEDMAEEPVEDPAG